MSKPHSFRATLNCLSALEQLLIRLVNLGPMSDLRLLTQKFFPNLLGAIIACKLAKEAFYCDAFGVIKWAHINLSLFIVTCSIAKFNVLLNYARIEAKNVVSISRSSEIIFPEFLVCNVRE